VRAALFPGQGSQHVGMGKFLEELSPVARQTFEEASDCLGYDIRKLCLDGPEDRLVLTEYTQPALLTVSTATSRTLGALDLLGPIEGSAGHSVGEYAALVLAQVFSFPKALELVRYRGQLMQQTVPVGEGGMCAVMGLDSEEVEKLCAWATQASDLGPIEPANYNSPGQIVISGRSRGLKWLLENLNIEKIGLDKKRKVRLIPLKVSAPFHCSLMNTAERELGFAIREVDFQKPRFAVAQNFSGKLETDPEMIKTNLIRQVSGPVRWIECVEALNCCSIETALELGPGKVLTGLIKKIAPHWTSYNFNTLEDVQSFEKQTQNK